MPVVAAGSDRTHPTERSCYSCLLHDDRALLVHRDEIGRAAGIGTARFRPEICRHHAQDFALHRLNTRGRAGGFGIGENANIGVVGVALYAAGRPIGQNDISILRVRRTRPMLEQQFEMVIGVVVRIRISRIDCFP